MLGGASLWSFVSIDLSVRLRHFCLAGCSSISLSIHVVVPRHELVLLTPLHLLARSAKREARKRIGSNVAHVPRCSEAIGPPLPSCMALSDTIVEFFMISVGQSIIDQARSWHYHVISLMLLTTSISIDQVTVIERVKTK
mmetsp:Transcript_8956/g.16138  ORF Transcript_8956/g.16138 Transcript_8956/m.16138 type:complete len:140 (-) Transcript_8956:1291-1710(-)